MRQIILIIVGISLLNSSCRKEELEAYFSLDKMDYLSDEIIIPTHVTPKSKNYKWFLNGKEISREMNPQFSKLSIGDYELSLFIKNGLQKDSYAVNFTVRDFTKFVFWIHSSDFMWPVEVNVTAVNYTGMFTGTSAVIGKENIYSGLLQEPITFDQSETASILLTQGDKGWDNLTYEVRYVGAPEGEYIETGDLNFQSKTIQFIRILD